MTVSTVATSPAGAASGRERPIKGGVATWACSPGFPPATIFPFTPMERIGIRNLFEFQVLMFRPLFWLGKDGQPDVDYDLSIGEPLEWSEDGRTVIVTVKRWKYSNGETIGADNVIFWVNMMKVVGNRYGNYSPGHFPDNLTSYEKIADNKVRFTFDKAYSKTWVLHNGLSTITPMPKAWDRFDRDTPANATENLDDVRGVYDYLVSENGAWTVEDNELRTRWPESPAWSVVSGPWRLKTFTLEGEAIFVPNEHYSGPNKPHLDEFREMPIPSDEDEYVMLKAGPHGPNSIQVGFLPYGLDVVPRPGEDDPLAEHYNLVPQDVYCIRFLPFNFHHPGTVGRIVHQTYFRQALQASLDQETAIREIFHGYGNLTLGPVPPVPDTRYISPAIRARGDYFDLDHARALLEDNGWDTSVTPAVCVRGGSGPGCAGEGIEAGDTLSFGLRYVEGRAALDQLMKQLAKDAAKVGIELRLEEVFGSVMVAEDHCPETPEKPHTWELNCWNGGWAFYGSPSSELLFKSGAGSNFGHYSDPKADELIDKATLSDDLAAFYEAEDYLAEQVPSVWTPNFPLRLLEIAKNLHGVEPINPYGMLTPENWYYVEED